MQFTHENYKKLNLVDYNVAKKRKIRFFYNWRTTFLKKKQETEAKIYSVTKICKIVKAKTDLNLRNKLCRWRDLIELRQY
jgi:hypothetical protein